MVPEGAVSAEVEFSLFGPPNFDDPRVLNRVDLDGFTLTVSTVPEPESYALMLAGLGLVAAVVRRRKLND